MQAVRISLIFRILLCIQRVSNIEKRQRISCFLLPFLSLFTGHLLSFALPLSLSAPSHHNTDPSSLPAWYGREWSVVFSAPFHSLCTWLQNSALMCGTCNYIDQFPDHSACRIFGALLCGYWCHICQCRSGW